MALKTARFTHFLMPVSWKHSEPQSVKYPTDYSMDYPIWTTLLLLRYKIHILNTRNSNILAFTTALGAISVLPFRAHSLLVWVYLGTRAYSWLRGRRELSRKDNTKGWKKGKQTLIKQRKLATFLHRGKSSCYTFDLLGLRNLLSRINRPEKLAVTRWCLKIGRASCRERV